MRTAFANGIIEQFKQNKQICFLTGDLGFMALEEVRDIMQQQFINMGISEQNIISVAAALAHEGFLPFVYSISAFITLRPYEQIRNNICLHKMPVKIIGNGGGYGYGIMGSTHHNIEDIGCMRILPNMKVFVPFHDNDVAQILSIMTKDQNPNYLRLNLGATNTPPPFAPYRLLKSGKRAVVIGTGPVTDNILQLNSSLLDDLEVWIVSQFPLEKLPNHLIEKIRLTKRVLTIEEHQGQCGLNEALAKILLQIPNMNINKYATLYAQGYVSGNYGNQQFHQDENKLHGTLLAEEIQKLLS